MYKQIRKNKDAIEELSKAKELFEKQGRTDDVKLL